MRELEAGGIPFLVGGAYAFERYTGIGRHTKDFDLFLHPRDVERALAVLAAVGCETELSFPHWLAKARCGDDVVDLIFSSGNGVALVDDDWFRDSVAERVLDVPVRLIPAEEMIWSKSFVMERERYDGADVAHVLRACADTLDWPRLLRRFDAHWRVLLHHLVIFGFIYPCERTRVPAAVMRELMGRLDAELTRPARERACQGTLISRAQYLVDVEYWNYTDPRLAPQGNMTSEERARWTAGISEDGPRTTEQPAPKAA
ncbi:MAG: nucleotidyltransferase family protein [Candidatus Rokuibacteriota bacterium]|nr:MAG: nucleotidyltransferase family protein [Candidatus Rokubacteria bacterium]